MKAVIVLLMVLSVILMALNLMQVNAASWLIQINDGLLRDIAATRYNTADDAQITAWHQPDGSILLIVNGYHEHVIPDGCGRF